jgi:hypothetical protein
MARLLAVVLALLPAALGALEVDDLRLTYAPWLGREFDATGQVEVIGPNGPLLESQEEVSTDANRHQRVGLSYRRSLGALQAGFGAPLLGLELGQDSVHEKQGQISYVGQTQLLDLLAGWAWKVRPNWHVEQGILIGAGHAHWQQKIAGPFFTDGAGWDDSTSGFAYEYGLSIGTYYAIADHLEVGLDVRHLVTRSRARFIGQHHTDPTKPDKIETASFDAKIDTRGFGVTLSTGYRF